MKKITTLLMGLLMASVAMAQIPFWTAPTNINGAATNLLGTSMSNNHKYVAGEEMDTRVPFIWNTETQDVQFIQANDASNMVMNGAFNGVNNSGIAVGSVQSQNDGISIAIMANMAEGGNYTTLYRNDSDQGSDAYGITEDGSVIVGFHFDESWTAKACIWTNNGQNRTDLPAPTVAQLGFEFDYVAARWISGNGNVILGYAQDYNSGEWVAMAWGKVGYEYTPYCFANNYYQGYTLDDEGMAVIPESPNPYFAFEPTALSYDGNYAALKLVLPYDLNDWFAEPEFTLGRINLTTGELEAMEDAPQGLNLILYGIANDGTSLGVVENESGNSSIYWAADGSVVSTEQLLAEVPAAAALREVMLTGISGDASTIMGYAATVTGQATTFVVQLHESSEPVGIDTVDTTMEPRVRGIYDMMGRKLNQISQPGIYIIDGKKVWVR